MSEKPAAKPRNVGGRPKAFEGEGSRLSVWLPANAHDRLSRLAASQEKSISSVVRSLLILRLK